MQYTGKKRFRFLGLAICATLVVILLLLESCSRTEPVALRKFPYPYRAALAICSDIDETESIEKFLSIQKFLNTDQETEFGRGVTLDIGNSFWFYNEYHEIMSNDKATIDRLLPGNPDFGISIFVGTTDSLTPYAEILARFIRAEYIDCLHSYGNFTLEGFDRDKAVTSIQFLNAQSLSVDVFVDHGGLENQHNIGDAPSFLGDNPESAVYHTDLTIQAGFKFLWRSQLTHCIGQDGTFSLKNLFKLTYEGFQDWRNAGQNFINDNKLVHIYELDDGQKVFDFVRYNNPWGRYSIAQEEFFANQLSANVVDELISNEGFMVFYTHFGTTRLPPFLHEGTISVLRHIQNRFDQGQLLVTTTSKLLNYYVHMESLNWHYLLSDDTLRIVVDSISNEVEGSYLPDVQDIEGITFYVPDSVTIFVTIGDSPIDIINNIEDETGQASVSIPWQRLSFPELPTE